MKFAKTSIINFVRAHVFAFGVFFTFFVFFFACGSFVAANGQTLQPTDSHIVSLYVDGKNTTVPTRATTVGNFLNKAHIKLNQADSVEPSEDTLIDSNNFNIQIYRARPVTIIDGTTSTHVLTPEKSPALIAKNAGISVYPEDNLTLTTANNFVEDKVLGEELIINRATPLTLSLYGSAPLTYRTHAKTVGDFLKEKNIVPEAGATVTPSTQTPISAGLPIYISKFGKTVITTEEPVDFPTNTTADSSRAAGVITVITPGVLGKEQVVYEVQLKDGQEIGRTKLQEVVTVQPQAQQQTIGTAILDPSGNKTSWMQAAGIDPSDYVAVDYVIGNESGWRPGAINSRGCAGLGQACPGSKLAAACPAWQVDPACQLAFFSSYASSRYGGWKGAASAWANQGWW